MGTYTHNGVKVNTMTGRQIILPSPQGKIRWHIRNFTSDQDKTKTIQAIKKGFDLWERIFNPIMFEGTNDIKEAHIVIHFSSDSDRSNPPPRPFGENVLGFAYALGDVWLNDDFDWQEIMKGERTTGRTADLFTAFVHELGHSFNIGHSESNEALMYASYNGVDSALSPYEVEAVDFLYGNIRAMVYKKKWAEERKILEVEAGMSPKATPKIAGGSQFIILGILGIVYFLASKTNIVKNIA